MKPVVHSRLDTKQENVEGRIVIARNIHWRPPASVRDAIESTFVRDRLAVLKGLAQLHRDGNDLVRAEVVNQARRLVDDDNEAVSAAAMELLTALNPEQARPEPEESRWLPAVSSRPQQAEEQDKKQVVTSPTLMLPADDTTARSGPLERETWADLYPAQAGGTPKKQVPQRSRQEIGEQTRRQANGRAAPSWLSQLARRRQEEQVRRQAEQYTTDTSVGGHLGLAESWGAVAHSPRALRSGRSIWVLTTVVVAAFITLLLLLFTDLFDGGPRPLALPNVVGEPVGNAEQRLNAAGFETEVRPVESTPQDLGRVVAMHPAGQALPETTIRLDVGTEEVDSSVAKGQVLKQNPAGGTDVKAGTTVTLAVSRG